jgi:hypothetical protein
MKQGKRTKQTKQHATTTRSKDTHEGREKSPTQNIENIRRRKSGAHRGETRRNKEREGDSEKKR